MPEPKLSFKISTEKCLVYGSDFETDQDFLEAVKEEGEAAFPRKFDISDVKLINGKKGIRCCEWTKF